LNHQRDFWVGLPYYNGDFSPAFNIFAHILLVLGTATVLAVVAALLWKAIRMCSKDGLDD